MNKDNIGVNVAGHVLITDADGTVLLDKSNAIHPRNLARVIARSLANESNGAIFRIAFGNGGTNTDAGFNVTFNPPRDGLPPDERTFDSRLYNETYSEVVDDRSALIGQDLGSTDILSTGNVSRSGGGADPTNDSGGGVVSNDLGSTSEVVITAVINANEPVGQVAQGVVGSSSGSFVFDELGLYTSGASAADSIGYANVDVGVKDTLSPTNLVPGDTYGFGISVDGGSVVQIDFIAPLTGGSGASGEILFGDLVEAINTGDQAWNPTWNGSQLPAGSVVNISDSSGLFQSTIGAETFGFLQFLSGTSGSSSSVVVSPPIAPVPNLFIALTPLATILAPVDGSDAGVENNAASPETERERLLSHLVFQPIFKAAGREITVEYTLTISVGRTVTQ